MRTPISISDVARDLDTCIDRVVRRGERFVLMRDGKPVAELRPAPVGRKLSEFPEIFASLPRLGADEAEAFGRDIDDAREELNRVPPRSAPEA